MNKVAVVYWSGTGNTQKMAESVAEGAKQSGAFVEIYTPDTFSTDLMDNFDTFAFGCPSMGCEQLEADEFEPMFLSCTDKISGKKIGLFGSYGWGDGEWMKNWQEQCVQNGAVLVADGIICNDSPDDDTIKNCIDLGKALA